MIIASSKAHLSRLTSLTTTGQVVSMMSLPATSQDVYYSYTWPYLAIESMSRLSVHVWPHLPVQSPSSDDAFLSDIYYNHALSDDQ